MSITALNIFPNWQRRNSGNTTKNFAVYVETLNIIQRMQEILSRDAKKNRSRISFQKHGQKSTEENSRHTKSTLAFHGIKDKISGDFPYHVFTSFRTEKSFNISSWRCIPSANMTTSSIYLLKNSSTRELSIFRMSLSWFLSIILSKTVHLSIWTHSF